MQDRIVYEVPVADVVPSPRNPRHRLEGLDELAESIRAHGLLQPIVVRRADNWYELVAGHRRLAAVQQLGWPKVPAVVRNEDAEAAYILTLVENLQRENLSPKEEAEALEVLVRERGWSTRQVGQAINRGPMYVSRRLRVFEDDALAPLVLADKLTVSTAEELLVVADARRRSHLAQQAVDERWERPQVRAAVRECIAAIQRQQSTTRDSSASTGRVARGEEVARLVGELRAMLDTAPISELPPLARRELRALYQRLALLVAD